MIKYLFFLISLTLSAQTYLTETFSDYRADSTAAYRKALYRINAISDQTDLTGHGFTLTKTSTGDSLTPGNSPIKSGEGVYFLSGNDYFVSAGGGIIKTSDVTISAWFRSALNPATNQPIVFEDNTSTLRDFQLQDRNTQDRLNWNIFIGNSFKNLPGTTAGSGYLNGAWHNVTGTHDGDSIRIYYEGVQQGVLLASGAIDNDGVPLRVGASGAVSPEFFTGHIAQVTIDTVALTAAQIKSLLFMPRNWLAVGADDPGVSRVSYGFYLGLTGADTVYYGTVLTAGNWTISIKDSAASGVSYKILTSTDAVTWTDFASQTTGTNWTTRSFTGTGTGYVGISIASGAAYFDNLTISETPETATADGKFKQNQGWDKFKGW